MSHTFEEYRRIFDGAIAKYEGQDFFSKLIGKFGRPAFPSAPRNVAIFGIRHEGQETKNRDDIADDTIALVRLDSDGLPMVKEYVGTTEPGLFMDVINLEGDFRLNPGFYFFKLGIHHPNKGANPCLVPAGDVLGERAKKGEAFDETDQKTWVSTDTTIHIHAGIKNVQHVGEWSAGCQVVAGGWEGAAWGEFFTKYVKIATNFPVPYVLVMENDVAQFLA
jgi:hypothetical protein